MGKNITTIQEVKVIQTAIETIEKFRDDDFQNYLKDRGPGIASVLGNAVACNILDMDEVHVPPSWLQGGGWLMLAGTLCFLIGYGLAHII